MKTHDIALTLAALVPLIGCSSADPAGGGPAPTEVVGKSAARITVDSDYGFSVSWEDLGPPPGGSTCKGAGNINQHIAACGNDVLYVSNECGELWVYRPDRGWIYQTKVDPLADIACDGARLFIGGGNSFAMPMSRANAGLEPDPVTGVMRWSTTWQGWTAVDKGGAGYGDNLGGGPGLLYLVALGGLYTSTDGNDTTLSSGTDWVLRAPRIETPLRFTGATVLGAGLPQSKPSPSDVRSFARYLDADSGTIPCPFICFSDDLLMGGFTWRRFPGPADSYDAFYSLAAGAANVLYAVVADDAGPTPTFDRELWRGTATETNCWDNEDNDKNGLADCADPACTGDLACKPHPKCTPTFCKSCKAEGAAGCVSTTHFGCECTWE